MILKSTFHQNDISCKRISPLKTSDILCEELLMDSVYVYVAMCFKSAFAQKRGTVHRESTLSGSVQGQPHSALHDLANSKPTANLPSRRLVATRCIRGQQDRSDSWLCPFPSTRKSYLSQSTTPCLTFTGILHLYLFWVSCIPFSLTSSSKGVPHLLAGHSHFLPNSKAALRPGLLATYCLRNCVRLGAPAL